MEINDRHALQCFNVTQFRGLAAPQSEDIDGSRLVRLPHRWRSILCAPLSFVQSYQLGACIQ